MKDVIRIIAYRNYENRVRKNLPGDALNDWLQAEREFNKAYSPQKTYEGFYGGEHEAVVR